MEPEEIVRILNEAYFSDSAHEKEVLDNLEEVLHSVKTFVDVGASLGQYTYHVNKSIKNGHLIAIEPDPLRFPQLEENCRKWESESNNKIYALKAAISDKDGTIGFFTTNSNVSGGLFKRSASNLPENVRKNIRWQEDLGDCYQLDTVFESLYPTLTPDFVKIDVEGSELRVLRGSRRILREAHATFLIELHDFIDPEGQKKPKEILHFMKSFGYHPINFHGRKLFVQTAFPRLPRLWFRGRMRDFLGVCQKIWRKIMSFVLLRTENA